LQIRRFDKGIIFVAESEEKRLGDNIKMDLKELWMEGVGLFDMAYCCQHGMKLRVL
jgi:hypothetical protein